MTSSGLFSRGEPLTTAAAGLSVALTASAFSGVLADSSWVLPAILVIGTVGLAGLAGRMLRLWPALIVLAQLAAVLVLLTFLFSSNGILGLLPGPAAIGELRTVLVRALDVVRTGVPPVAAEPALRCLITLGLGLVAVLVDAISIATATPAVAGLVLLCVFALPASLSDKMLPWWTFAGGALGFSLLLVSRRSGWRAQQRGQLALFDVRNALNQQFVAVGGAAIAAGLLAGVVFTGVGTEGRLPGDRDTADAIGVRPFTSLRGQLNRGRTIDLFRVHGLPQDAYLRVMTLRDFNPEQGWELGTLTQGVDAGAGLPLPDGTLARPPGREIQVQIEPVGYRDPWLPSFGVPLQVAPPGPGWRYDHSSGTMFTQVRQELKPYTERFVLPEPEADQLRAADGPIGIDPAYINTAGVPPEITALAQHVTAGSTTPFDKAVALNRLFTEPENGFSYDLETAPATGGSGLSDFLLRGKRGYCEQFASSMAVLLRSIGIPSRVAVGFTAGYRDGADRVITTDDAHAWVEAFFPGTGWVTFDPTPLRDGRTALPRYLQREVTPQPAAPPPSVSPGNGTPPPGQAQQQPQPSQSSTEPAARPRDRGGPPGELLWALAAVPLVIAILAIPAAIRQWRRRRRLRAIETSDPAAASLAWHEVLDAYWDRRVRAGESDTARTTAQTLMEQHQLDAEGAEALKDLVIAAERNWYGPEGQSENESVKANLRTVLASVNRAAPLSWRERLFPRSVLQPRQRHYALR